MTEVAAEVAGRRFWTDLSVNLKIMIAAMAAYEAWGAIRDQQNAPLILELRQQLEDIDAAENSATAAEARSAYESSRLQSILLLVLGIACALGRGGPVARGIVRSLSRVTTVCEGLAAGDLTQRAGLNSHDEPGRMGRAREAAITRLRDTVSTIGGSQTAKATEEITGRIGAIQESSDSAATAISEITHVIQRIGDYTTTIASAVEEQTATTGEMSRSVAEAATSSGDVARTVSGVAEVATATADGALATQQAASDLTRLAGDLTNLVGGFRH